MAIKKEERHQGKEQVPNERPPSAAQATFEDTDKGIVHRKRCYSVKLRLIRKLEKTKMSLLGEDQEPSLKNNLYGR